MEKLSFLMDAYPTAYVGIAERISVVIIIMFGYIMGEITTMCV